MAGTARTTGWAAIGYAAVYVATFVTNTLASALGPAAGIRFRTPDQMTADRLLGDVGAIEFALLGAALIVVAMGLRRLIWDEESIIGAAASSIGVVAGAGLMLAGAALGAQRGSAPNDLAGTGADIAMQRAVVQGGYLLINAATFLASLALLIWLSSIAIAARKARTLSSPMIVATWLTALAPFASSASTGFAFGLILTIPYAASLGISLIRRARHMELDADGVAASAASSA